MNAALPERTGVPEAGCPCFIAGTLVHTDKGLVPIEQIKIGDSVLSQPEQGGERAYRKVVKTFVHEDKQICVVKYMLIDGEVPYDHPDYYPKDDTMHHCYATGNHPFWVEGIGWTAAECLRSEDVLQLHDGRRAVVKFSWPVIRSTQPGFGRVCTNRDSDGRESHIVDFRNGSDLWKYERWKPNAASAPYHAGYMDDELVVISEILESDDPNLRTRVYNLEVEGSHTYYVGENGVWVHNLCKRSNRT